MFDFWESELTEEETEALLDKAAAEIRKRKLETPAILMLESHKPLAFIGGNTALTFAPFLVPLLGFDFVNNYSRLLSKRENFDKLMDKLDQPRREAEQESAEDSCRKE